MKGRDILSEKATDENLISHHFGSRSSYNGILMAGQTDDCNAVPANQ